MSTQIAALISSVKTNPPEQAISPLASQLVSMAESSSDIPSPDIPRLTHWFTAGAALALAKLTPVLADVPDPGVHAALRVALSRIIVRASRQDSDTRLCCG